MSEEKREKAPYGYEDEESIVMARLPRTKTSSVLVRLVNRKWADMRIYADSEKYTGPTKTGLRFSIDLVPDIIKALEELMERQRELTR